MGAWRRAGRVQATRAPGAPVIGLLVCLGLAGCGGDGSTTVPAPPPPPAVTVAFEPGPLDVREGETAEIRVAYQVHTLDAPWTLTVSTLPVTASAADFELSGATIDIPAGQGVSGESSFELAALADSQFDEGPETGALRFVPGGGVNARLGADLQVSIQDGGVAPCPALNIVATRPERGEPANIYIHRTFTLQVMEGGQGPVMEFVAPYRKVFPDLIGDLPNSNTNLAINIEAWELTTAAQHVEHAVDIQMRNDTFRDLELAFHAAECDAAGVVCTTEECSMRTAN